MALNAKAAICMCLTFIGGLSWVVQGFSPPHMNRISPLARSEVTVVDAEPAPGAVVTPPLAQAGREELARRLAWPSASTRAERDRAAREALALAPPVQSAADTPRLPPLAVQTNALAVARTSPDQGLDGERPAAAEVILVEAGGPSAALAGEEPVGGDEAEPVSASPAARTYRVVRGDSLTRIAARQWDSRDPRLVELLREANPQVKARGGKLLLGEQLHLPAPADVQHLLASESTALAAARVGPPDAAATPATGTAGQRWYTIQPRDSLTTIAQRFLRDGRRWPEIAAANRSLNPQRIQPGTRIKIPPVVRVAQR